MSETRPFITPHFLELGAGLFAAIFGGTATFSAVVAFVLWLFGRASGEIVVVAALAGLGLLGVGLWLLRRSRLKTKPPLDARIFFLVMIIHPLAGAAMDLAEDGIVVAVDTFVNVAVILITISFGMWFFVRYVLPEVRR